MLLRHHIIQGALRMKAFLPFFTMRICLRCCSGYINDIAGVDVLVDEADYEAAVRLLEQNEMIPEQLKYCLSRFADIKFVLKKRASAGWLSCRHRLFVGGYSPGNNHWEYVCHACGGKFEKPVAEFHSAEV